MDLYRSVHMIHRKTLCFMHGLPAYIVYTLTDFRFLGSSYSELSPVTAVTPERKKENLAAERHNLAVIKADHVNLQ